MTAAENGPFQSVAEAAQRPMLTTVVRGFGYEVHHVVTVPQQSVVDGAWPSIEHKFKGILTPVVARCGRQVRSVQPLVVIMAEGARVTCRQCRMFSGVEAQPVSSNADQQPSARGGYPAVDHD